MEKARVEKARATVRIASLTMAGTAALLLAACATTPQPTRQAGPPAPPPPPPTPEQEFAWSTAPGTNTLTVNLAYQPAPGQQWSCSGMVEALMPETSYSRGRMALLYGSPERAIQSTTAVRERSAANPGPDYSQFVRTATCSADNSFTFSNLPAGNYFVIARVKQVRPPAANEMVIMQRVSVAAGAPTRITLPQAAPARR